MVYVLWFSLKQCGNLKLLKFKGRYSLVHFTNKRKLILEGNFLSELIGPWEQLTKSAGPWF
jgi:hypothetical protein